MTTFGPSPIVKVIAGASLRIAMAFMFIHHMHDTACAEVPAGAGRGELEALPLPRWSEQELKAFRESLPAHNNPGVLLPENGRTPAEINELLLAPVASGPRLDDFFSSPDVELSPRLRPEDMRLFLPESILNKQHLEGPSVSTRLPTPISSIRELPPEFLARCEQAQTSDYLIDPDLLVPEMQNHDLKRFLEFHARDARIKLHLVIIPHDRQFPAEADLGKIASGRLLQTDSCLVIYPLGEPWRTRLFMSKAVHEGTSAVFLSETIQACLHEALQASDVHDQLQRYAVHLSTRLFWLQRALGNQTSVEGDIEQPLAEISPKAESHAQGRPDIFNIVAWIVLGMLMLLLAATAARKLQSYLRSRRRNIVWQLPEPETLPRLGGAFTGGGGGMIRYS